MANIIPTANRRQVWDMKKLKGLQSRRNKQLLMKAFEPETHAPLAQQSMLVSMGFLTHELSTTRRVIRLVGKLMTIIFAARHHARPFAQSVFFFLRSKERCSNEELSDYESPSSVGMFSLRELQPATLLEIFVLSLERTNVKRFRT